jgi:hypothetical protein
MRTLFTVLGLLLLCPLAPVAGGDSFLAEIVSLTSKGDDEYRLELVPYSAQYGGKTNSLSRHIIVHLRFNRPLFTHECPVCPTKAKYLAAIESLKTQAAKGGKSPFGVMSIGFEPIKGRKNEFQSNALCILKEFNGREVV